MAGYYRRISKCPHRSGRGGCHFPNLPRKDVHVSKCPYHANGLLSNCEKLNPKPQMIEEVIK